MIRKMDRGHSYHNIFDVVVLVVVIGIVSVPEVVPVSDALSPAFAVAHVATAQYDAVLAAAVSVAT